jgi:PAS domain-containing protein
MSRDTTASAMRLDGAGERVSPSVEIAAPQLAGETLREEGTAFRALVEQEVAGVYIVAADGTLAYVNPYIARCWAMRPPKSSGGRCWSSLLNGKTQQ